MHPEMNPSLSSVPSSLDLLADLDILAKSVDPDFVPVSDVVLLSSFDLPVNTSINDLSKGTLVHRLVSDASVRPSSEWWLDALDAVFKYYPTEMDVAPCVAEIYLARVAQAHIEAGHSQLDYLEGKASGMQFIDSNEEPVSIVFKQEDVTPEGTSGTPAIPTIATAPKGGWPEGSFPDQTITSAGKVEGETQPLATGTQAELDTTGALPDTSTETPVATDVSVGGPITSAVDVPLTTETFDPGITTGDSVDKDLDGALVREGRRGEEVQHDNVDAAAMGGLGLSGDEEIKGNDCGCDHPCPSPCGCEDEIISPEIMATRKEEEDAKQGLKDDIELLTRKIEEADKWKALLDKVSAFTGEQDSIKRIESRVHSGHPITVGNDDLEMKAGGT